MSSSIFVDPLCISSLLIGVLVALVMLADKEHVLGDPILLIAGISAIAATETVTIWLVVTLRLVLNYICKLTEFETPVK